MLQILAGAARTLPSGTSAAASMPQLSGDAYQVRGAHYSAEGLLTLMDS